MLENVLGAADAESARYADAHHVRTHGVRQKILSAPPSLLGQGGQARIACLTVVAIVS